MHQKILPLKNKYQNTAINEASENNDMYQKTKIIQVQKPWNVENRMNYPVMIPSRFIHHVRITK